MAVLEETLETLGFKEEEVKTYLSLLDAGTVSGGELAKKMGMKRSTIYGYLDKLVAGGLAVQSTRHGVKVYAAEPGDKIRLLYKRKIDDLRTKEKGLDELIPELARRTGTSLMRPKMQFFEGRSGMETALQDHLAYRDIKMLAFWSIKAAIDATSEDFFWYINKERIKRNMYLEGIWPMEQAVEVRRFPFMGVGEEFKREIRVAPEGVESSMGYWIYANKVLFASSQAESFCFIIESAELVQMMSNQHRLIWEQSMPIAPSPSDMQPFLDDLYED